MAFFLSYKDSKFGDFPKHLELNLVKDQVQFHIHYIQLINKNLKYYVYPTSA
jgi:hypothetical protein